MTEKLKKSGLDYEVVGHPYGIAAEKVEKTERENEIGMIIIGIQKPSILRKIFGGQHTGKAIYGSRAPVLMVKHGYVSKVKALIGTGLIEPIKVVPKESEKPMEALEKARTLEMGIPYF